VNGMTASRDQILATIDERADELRGCGAKSLALFGSVARVRAAILGEAVRASRL